VVLVFQTVVIHSMCATVPYALFCFVGLVFMKRAEVATKVVEIVKNFNGRFLKQDQAGWVVVPSDVARDKCSHAFRNLRLASTKLKEEKMKDKGNKSDPSKPKAPPRKSLQPREDKDGTSVILLANEMKRQKLGQKTL
jgi:hypothetical protein